MNFLHWLLPAIVVLPLAILAIAKKSKRSSGSSSVAAPADDDSSSSNWDRLKGLRDLGGDWNPVPLLGYLFMMYAVTWCLLASFDLSFFDTFVGKPVFWALTLITIGIWASTKTEFLGAMKPIRGYIALLVLVTIIAGFVKIFFYSGTDASSNEGRKASSVANHASRPVAATDAWDRIDSPLKRQVMDAFPGDPVMHSIAACESQFLQFNADGTVVENQGHYGVFQIDTSHSHDGNDIKTLAGNIAEAKLLHTRNGYKDWQSDSRSEHCWNKLFFGATPATALASTSTATPTTVGPGTVVKDTLIVVNDTSSWSPPITTTVAGQRMRIDWDNYGKPVDYLVRYKRFRDGAIIDVVQKVLKPGERNSVIEYPEWVQFKGDSISMQVRLVKVY